MGNVCQDQWDPDGSDEELGESVATDEGLRPCVEASVKTCCRFGQWKSTEPNIMQRSLTSVF